MLKDFFPFKIFLKISNFLPEDTNFGWEILDKIFYKNSFFGREDLELKRVNRQEIIKVFKNNITNKCQQCFLTCES